MTTTEWLVNYYTLNNSFKKRLVFRIGVDSGFFSNYNNLVLAQLYCLKHHIKFELYSDWAKYASRDGWNDFFVPFANQNRQLINRDYNLRPYIIKQSKEPALQKAVKYRFITAAYKQLFGIDYLTQDLWAHHHDPAFAHTTFTVRELGFQDTQLLEATQQVIRAFWQYNAQSAPVVAGFVAAAGLPADGYVSLHVRAGDKFTETKLHDFSEYMKPAEQLAPNRKAFVMTDDYTVVEQLRAQYPAWEFYTLCEPTERGYFHKEFAKLSEAAKHEHHLRLFAEVDIASRSTSFIGTYSSNIGMFMGMRIGPARCHCIDFDQWQLWQ